MCETVFFIVEPAVRTKLGAYCCSCLHIWWVISLMSVMSQGDWHDLFSLTCAMRGGGGGTVVKHSLRRLHKLNAFGLKCFFKLELKASLLVYSQLIFFMLCCSFTVIRGRYVFASLTLLMFNLNKRQQFTHHIHLCVLAHADWPLQPSGLAFLQPQGTGAAEESQLWCCTAG